MSPVVRLMTLMSSACRRATKQSRSEHSPSRAARNTAPSQNTVSRSHWQFPCQDDPQSRSRRGFATVYLYQAIEAHNVTSKAGWAS